MEDITQHQLSAAELFKSLAKEHQVPIEIAEQMAHLMARYPDLSLTGSRAELIDELEKILESAFKNKVVEVE